MWKALQGQGPQYIQRLSQVYNPGTSLRSASRCPLLAVARVNHAVGEKPPSRMALHLWNSLLESIRVLGTKPQFQSNLKTHLFRKHFSDWFSVYACGNGTKFIEMNLELKRHRCMCLYTSFFFSVFLTNPSQSINVSGLISSNLALCVMHSALEHIFVVELTLYKYCK